MSDKRTSSFSWEIPPFYEANDVSPHPTLPILLAQTELIIQQPQQLLATQEIGPRSTLLADRHQRTRVRFTPNKARFSVPPSASVSREATPGHSTHDQDGFAAPSRSGSAAPSDHHDDDDGTSSRGGSAAPPDRGRTRRYSTSRATSAALTDRGRARRDSDAYELIPKPEGEAGRPKRGGYNLQKTLGWPTNDYLRFKLFIKKAVEDHLEPSKTFSDQSLESLCTVQALAAETFPILADYVDWWPATDFIRVELHYTRSRAKEKSKVADATLGKKIRQQRNRSH